MAKQFTASFSKLKNFEQCAFRHQQVDLLKKYVEKSDQLEWGERVHKAFENAFLRNQPLPENMAPWQKWVTLAKHLPGEHLVEEKWALTRDLQPTEYFGPRCWWRGRGDFVALQEKTAAILDWKTGGMKHDSVQLLFSAACLFAYHRSLEKIRTTFVWLPDDETSGEWYTRKEVADQLKNGILERVAEMERAALNNIYPKRPSGLCIQYCPVDVCEFHKKGSPR